MTLIETRNKDEHHEDLDCTVRIYFSKNFNSQYLLTIKKGDIMSTPYEDDDREMTWEEKVDDYIEELEDSGWDWDAHDPCN